MQLRRNVGLDNIFDVTFYLLFEIFFKNILDLGFIFVYYEFN